MADFDSFLIDHADCERKASFMVMSFIGKFPERKEIIPEQWIQQLKSWNISEKYTG